MIIERMEFKLKFGHAKQAVALWKEMLAEYKKRNPSVQVRLLTDFTGPNYTMVLEAHINSFSEMNLFVAKWDNSEVIRSLYHKFVPLCESSSRTIYKIECII
jgi:hypothetical protein